MGKLLQVHSDVCSSLCLN